MKRSPLKRQSRLPAKGPLARGYIKRKTPLRAVSRKSVAKKRAKLGLADEAYLAWIRRQRCVVCLILDRIHAHHLKHGRGEDRGGMGIRVHDRKTLPLCARHHGHFHRGIGLFLGWTKEEKRLWQEGWVRKVSAQYARERKKSGG